MKELSKEEKAKRYDEVLKGEAQIDFGKKLYKAFGQVNDFTLGMRIARYFFELGTKAEKEDVIENLWHDASEEPKEGFSIVVYMKDDSLKVLTSWGENGDFCIGEGFWCNIHQQRKWAYVDNLINLSNVEKTRKDWKEEPVISNVNVEPIGVPAGVVELANVPDRKEYSVSEELEKAAKDYARFDDYYDNKEYDGFKAGAKWERNHIWHDATEEPVEEEYPIIVIDSANCVYLIDKDDSEPFDSKDKWLSVHDILPKKD